MRIFESRNLFLESHVYDGTSKLTPGTHKTTGGSKCILALTVVWLCTFFGSLSKDRSISNFDEFELEQSSLLFFWGDFLAWAKIKIAFKYEQTLTTA
jgi:hypothetical protein